MQLPLLMVVGVRNALVHQAGQTADNCPAFVEPILQAWKLPSVLLDPNRTRGDDLIAALRRWQRTDEAGVVLIAE